ncbi:MAG: hypothetical protein Tsb0020_00040 [Haliangiales bacterium]
MPSCANRFIPCDTLLEVGRVNRQPLRQWAEDLISKLATTNNADSETWLDVTGCMNNAALIEVFRGELQSARKVCDLQLSWVAGLVRTYGPMAACDLALQPWVNIGRLLRITGDYDAALSHFTMLLDTGTEQDLQLGPVAIDASTWQEVARAKKLDNFLEAVYVVDSAKTYFAAKDFQGALDFLRSAAPFINQGVAPMRAEAEVIALANLERYQDALAIMNLDEWQQDNYTKLVRVTYRVGIMAAAGYIEQAEKLLQQLVGRVLAAKFDDALDPRVLRYLHYLCVLAVDLGRSDLAVCIAQKGLSTARKISDVPLILTFLDLLIETEAAGKREVFMQERAALLETCLYKTLLKPRGRRISEALADNPIFPTLLTSLEAVADNAASSQGAQFPPMLDKAESYSAHR